MELVAVILARLLCRAKESLKLALGKVRYFMDSSAILEMLKIELGKFKEFAEPG